MTRARIGRLCVVGVGLIGGSFARAVRKAGLCAEIVGYSRHETDLRRAVELGVIDRYETRIDSAVAGADLIFVAVPLGAMESVFSEILLHCEPEAVITDGGSAKGSVVEAMRRAAGKIPPRFVPGHPIAGTERSGVEASFDSLYENRRIILTPVAETDPEAIARVRGLWEGIGAEVVEMEIDHHDKVLAATSHLPHMLAYTLVDTLAQMDKRQEVFRYAAGGFRDFTRIASSDPVMWRDICVNNRDALLEMIERFHRDLNALAEIIRAEDAEALFTLFKRAKTARDRFANLEFSRLDNKDHY